MKNNIDLIETRVSLLAYAAFSMSLFCELKKSKRTHSRLQKYMEIDRYSFVTENKFDFENIIGYQ